MLGGVGSIEPEQNFDVRAVLEACRRLSGCNEFFPKVEIEPVCGNRFEQRPHRFEAFRCPNPVSGIHVGSYQESRVLAGESKKSFDLVISDHHRRSAKTGVVRLDSRGRVKQKCGADGN